MNQIAWQIYGGSNRKANTFIGGVAATITTAGALATKLGIASNRITNFKIVGSDIECRISGSYSIPVSCFRSDTFITYYRDTDNLVVSIGSTAFQYTTLMTELDLAGVLNSGSYYGSNINRIIFKNCTTVPAYGFDSSGNVKLIYIPNATSLGGTSGNNDVFTIGGGTPSFSGRLLYVHPSLATNNAGAPDGDLAYAISQGAIVRYVTNFTAPNPITNLSVGNVYGTAIQLNFTAPTGSTNAIEFYEIYINGVYNRTVTASGQYITGLSLNNAYTIEVKPVDIFYNKSTSNVVSATTAISYTDADANAYISAATLTGIEQDSAYQLITDLKTAGLWTKIQALYPFKGTTAAQHKWNAKNPLNTDAAFRLTFSGTGAYSNLGYLTGGGYANTFLIPNSIQNLNSNGLTAVVGTNNTANTNDTIMGAFGSGSNASWIVAKGSNTTFLRELRLNFADVQQTGINEARGIWTGTRQSAISKFIRNNSLIGSVAATGNLPTFPIWIGDLNNSGSQYASSFQRIQIAIIHEGLTDAEVTTLHLIIDTSETIAGRKTW